MRTIFDLGDKIFIANQYKKEGYDELGEVKEIKLVKYDEDTEGQLYIGYINAKYGDTVEIIIYEDGNNLRSLSAKNAFNNKEDAIMHAIMLKDARLAEMKTKIAEEEKSIAYLKSQIKFAEEVKMKSCLKSQR